VGGRFNECAGPHDGPVQAAHADQLFLQLMIQKHRPQKKNLAFFWHPLDEPPGDEYDVIFR